MNVTPSELLEKEFQELRLRRDNEEKLVRLWLVVCSGVFTGTFAFAQSPWAEPHIIGLFCLFAAILLKGMSCLITSKINAEHKVYSGIGKTIVALLSIDYSFGDVIPSKINIGEDIKKIGQGDGYERTADIVSVSALITAMALVCLAFFCWVWPLEKPEQKPLAVTITNSGATNNPTK